MVRLLLLRHAKSSWSDPGMADYDRPLNPRGRTEAPLIGRLMADQGLLPDLVLCSGARRTRETLSAILPFFREDTDIQIRRAVYDVEGSYVRLLREAGGKAGSFLLIGHNPEIQQTALSLIGGAAADLIRAMEAKYPTAGLAVLDFDLVDWRDLKRHSGRLAAFFQARTPRNLSPRLGAAKGEFAGDDPNP